ncbi:MAG: hypothetical protein KJ000_08520 [Pirellulaceae bacterium]|nr:hypothetical protein [Pirellulaceae bacterium]
MADAGPARQWLFVAVLLGLPFSQVYLMAFWVAFSQRRLAVRVLVGAVLVVSSWFFVFGLIGEDMPGDPWVPGIAMLVQFTAGTVLLGGVRAAARLRLAKLSNENAAVPAGPLQFGIRHLLITTALVSVVLAIARVTLPNLTIAGGELMAFLLFLACNLVLFFPLSLAMLIQRGCGWAIVASAIWTICLTPVEWMAFHACGYDDPETRFWWSVNGVLWGSLAISLLMARFAGWRLVRFPSSRSAIAK